LATVHRDTMPRHLHLRARGSIVASGVLASFALSALVLVPLYAWRARGREYAIFGLVILALSLPGAVVAQARLPRWHMLDALFIYGLAAAVAHLIALVHPRLRRPPFRFAVSIPGMAFLAAGFLSGLWLLALLPVRGVLGLLGWTHALAALRFADLLPFGIAALSVVTSLRVVREVVRVPLAADGPTDIERIPVQRYRHRHPAPLPRRPLRIVQVADPHLGPWQSIATLRRRIAALVAQDPDLVVLTGDFLTMEGAATRGALAEALAPLRAMSTRCFAIFGNHDHESPGEVRSALAANGIRLLIDTEAAIETDAGPVQIIGADWVGSHGRREHIQALLARHPRRDGYLRLLLLHDPSAFRHVPKGDVDLTLSGHTHGGQLGLVSFGFDWTVLARTAWPDHGLFGHGANRLYVHRGIGFYGFPLRIGVPGEASVLEIVPA
jgi:predicted MPP superfamily phosphohydrolase